MDARHTDRLEAAVELAAAATLAAAVGFAAFRLGWPLAAGASAAAASLWAGSRVQRSIGSAGPSFALAPFEPAPLPPPEDVGELILSDSDRLGPVDELVLDDVLARLEDFSRVVRLFDRTAMPTPAELKSRIDRHPDEPRPDSAPDASQALHDALSELRRTLR